MYFGRMRAESREVFPRGVIALEVQPAAAFNGDGERGEGQALDEQTGLSVWNFVGIDVRGLDPEERADGTYRGSPEVKVKILSDVEPVIPKAQSAFGAVVEFEDLMVSPYLDSDRCTPADRGKSKRCRTQMKYSLRATGIRPIKN